MFCSKCLECSELETIQRRICNNGHILCEDCDDRNCCECLLCEASINKFVRIETCGDVPALFIFTESTKKSKIPVKIERPVNTGKTNSQVIREHLAEYHDYKSSTQQQQEHQHRSDQNCGDYHSNPGSSKFAGNLTDEQAPTFFGSNGSENSSFRERGNIIELNNVPVFEIHRRIPETEDSSQCYSYQTQRIERTKIFSNATNQTQIEGQHYERHEVSYSASERGDYEQISEYVRIQMEKRIGETCQQNRSSEKQRGYPKKSDGFEGSSASNSRNPTATTSNVEEFYRNYNMSDGSNTANFNSSPTSERKMPSPPSKYRIPLYTFASRAKFCRHLSETETPCPPQSEPLYYFKNGSPISVEDFQDTDRVLPKGPITCPVTFCEKISVPSDYCCHIITDHPFVQIRRIYPEYTANFEVNMKCDDVNFVKCQLLVLVTNKIRNIGYGQFSDYLPVTVMSSKVNLMDVVGQRSNDSISLRKIDNYYLLWLVGIYEYPQCFTLTVWRHGKDEPKVIKSISNTISFITQKQSISELFCSGNVLMISELEMGELTENFQKTVKCQLTIH